MRRAHGDGVGVEPFRLMHSALRPVRRVRPASGQTFLRRHAGANPRVQPEIDRGCFPVRRSLGLVPGGDWDLPGVALGG